MHDHLAALSVLLISAGCVLAGIALLMHFSRPPWRWVR